MGKIFRISGVTGNCTQLPGIKIIVNFLRTCRNCCNFRYLLYFLLLGKTQSRSNGQLSDAGRCQVRYSLYIDRKAWQGITLQHSSVHMGSPEHLRYTSTDTRRGCPKSSADRKKPSRPEGLVYGHAGEEQDTKTAFLQLPFAAFRNVYS